MKHNGLFTSHYSLLTHKCAFTLAEVLITLGIIGIVAALTIPSLITNYKANKLRAQFLKSYSTVQQVFKQMEADGVSLNAADYTDHASYYKTFANYLAGVTDCGVYGVSCFSVELRNNYNNMNKEKTSVSSDNPPVMVSVDLNGFKNPPNRFGYDVFTFQLVDENLKTMGDRNTMYTDMDKYCSLNSKDKYNGIACAQKARSESDYFKWVVKNMR